MSTFFVYTAAAVENWDREIDREAAEERSLRELEAEMIAAGEL